MLWKQLRGPGKRLREALSSEPRNLLCVCWVVVPLAGYLVLSLSKPIYPHYLIVLYPVQFWLAAAALDWATGQGSPRWRWVGNGLVAVMAVSQILFWQGFIGFIDRKGGAAGDYGVAYKHKLAAARHITDTCRQKQAAPVVLSAPGASSVEIQYLVMLEGGGSLVDGGDGDGRVATFLVSDRWHNPGVPLRGEAESFGPLKITQAGSGAGTAPRPPQ